MEEIEIKVKLLKVPVALGHGCDGCFFDGTPNCSAFEEAECISSGDTPK